MAGRYKVRGVGGRFQSRGAAFDAQEAEAAFTSAFINTPTGEVVPEIPSQNWDYYWPTRSINPPRPRTLQARYSPDQQRVEVVFRDSTPWSYEGVDAITWFHFKRAASPGRFIRSTLDAHPYHYGGWGVADVGSEGKR